jgi:hypothetical protein
MRIGPAIAIALFTAQPFFFAPAAAAPDVVRHPATASERDQRNDYYRALLELALEKSRGEYGDYRLEPAAESVGQGRALSMLADGEGLDVVWTMTSREREQNLRPVRIPLLRGLMGLRVLIIRAGDQPWFRHIESIDQLRKLRAGQGHDWPDARILRANDLPLMTMDSYEGMFRMLAEGRFDYLPRAVNEPWAEVEAFDEWNLAIEEELLLYYPAASYFFVRPGNDRLARRLRAGLEHALADGSFRELFRDHPINQKAFNKVDLLRRRVLCLKNPLLPETTPLQEDRLWWLPSSLRCGKPLSATMKAK